MEQPLKPDFSLLPGKVCSFLSAKRAIPEPPDSENAGSYARSGDIYGVLWSPRFGASCPQCGAYTKRAYKHSPWQDNYKTRYHLCPQCGFRFKSVAEDINISPTPEQLRYLRKYGK